MCAPSRRMAARARALAKPVVALKVGRSGGSARGDGPATRPRWRGPTPSRRAFLGRLGIATVATLPELVETLKLLHVHGALAGRDLCSLSCSGGEAALVADAAIGRGVRFRPLTPDERGRVGATLGPLVGVANPLDYHTFIWNDRARMAETYAAMLGCGFDLGLLVLDFPRDDRCSAAAWECAVDAIVRRRRPHGRADRRGGEPARRACPRRGRPAFLPPASRRCAGSTRRWPRPRRRPASPRPGRGRLPPRCWAVGLAGAAPGCWTRREAKRGACRAWPGDPRWPGRRDPGGGGRRGDGARLSGRAEGARGRAQDRGWRRGARPRGCRGGGRCGRAHAGRGAAFLSSGWSRAPLPS